MDWCWQRACSLTQYVFIFNLIATVIHQRTCMRRSSPAHRTVTTSADQRHTSVQPRHHRHTHKSSRAITVITDRRSGAESRRRGLRASLTIGIKPIHATDTVCHINVWHHVQLTTPIPLQTIRRRQTVMTATSATSLTCLGHCVGSAHIMYAHMSTLGSEPAGGMHAPPENTHVVFCHVSAHARV
jgi:hypothetical protein